MSISIRAAEARDVSAIRGLLRGEGMSVIGLDWHHFVVAEAGGRLVGCGQLRPRGGDVTELASLVVVPEYRHMGVAARLIAAALRRAAEGVMLITAARHAEHYRRWGFRRIPMGFAPCKIALIFLVGQAACLLAPVLGRAPRRLVIMERFQDPPRMAA